MKRFIALNAEQIEELKALLKSEKNVKIHRRLQFIQMKYEGKKNTEIMPIIGVSMETCRDWTGIFLREGLPGLCRLQYA
jgi:transposase